MVKFIMVQDEYGADTYIPTDNIGSLRTYKEDYIMITMKHGEKVKTKLSANEFISLLSKSAINHSSVTSSE